MATREAALLRERKKSASAKEIGPGWDVQNPQRRKRCLGDLRSFLKIYFPRSFRLEWSPDQLRVISKIEDASKNGGLFALAMPRGSGKTTICDRAALWCVLSGLHRFVLLVAATEEKGADALKRIKRELRQNELLAEDFPEACHPIRALNNEARRCIGQTWGGINTDIGWGQTQLVFPSAPEHIESNCRGAVISVAGMTSAIRGHSELLPTGETIRPSFMLIDDPQTRESAESLSQCVKREAIIGGDVLGSAGPDEQISAVMPCTVIRKGDVADNLLDRSKHPDWNGERMKMVYAFPKNQALWDEYAEIRATSLREGRGMKSPTAFYRKNRKAMDAGAEVAWKQRKRPDELSAIQNAMNLLYRDRPAFFAEYQNDPIEQKDESEKILTADEISAKLSKIDRGAVAVEWSHVTAFIDVQKEALYWVVCAWGVNFSGGVIDYGCFPEQGRPYFSYGDLSRKLSSEFPGKSEEAVIYAGLSALVNELCSRTWMREDGTALRIEKLLIDQGYQTDTIHQFCRQSPFGGIVMPAKGKGIKAGMKPLNEYKTGQAEKARGEKAGMNWRISTVEGRSVRFVLVDTNEWKKFLFSRLATSQGSAGCLSLFGSDASKHRMFADQLTSEYAVKTFGNGRDVLEWYPRPEHKDNHWFDATVGCAVAASIVGCGLPESGGTIRPRKPRVALAEMGRAS